MAMIIILFICVMFFDSSQSASFECEYKNGSWTGLDTVYYCDVQNAVIITTPDAAQVDSISGQHLTGYNKDNVDGFCVNQQVLIHYFPRGLNKFFKNLKGIYIVGAGLKEIHQSDLKYFPKLTNLYLHYNNLKILEKNLFEFNPNLEFIYLVSNKISHIDPNVFDNLTKLNSLALQYNTCINMTASDNPIEVQNVIKAAKAQCTNSEYSNLVQKLTTLENESKNLNPEVLKEKLEKLENEIEDSNFPNLFQEKIEGLKVVLIEKEKEAQREAPEKLMKLEEKVSKLSKDMSTALKDIESANHNFATIMKLIENFGKKLEKIEEKLEGIDDVQKNLMDKINKLESDKSR